MIEKCIEKYYAVECKDDGFFSHVLSEDDKIYWTTIEYYATAFETYNDAWNFIVENNIESAFVSILYTGFDFT